MIAPHKTPLLYLCLIFKILFQYCTAVTTLFPPPLWCGMDRGPCARKSHVSCCCYGGCPLFEVATDTNSFALIPHLIDHLRLHWLQPCAFWWMQMYPVPWLVLVVVVIVASLWDSPIAQMHLSMSSICKGSIVIISQPLSGRIWKTAIIITAENRVEDSRNHPIVSGIYIHHPCIICIDYIRVKVKPPIYSYISHVVCFELCFILTFLALHCNCHPFHHKYNWY